MTHGWMIFANWFECKSNHSFEQSGKFLKISIERPTSFTIMIVIHKSQLDSSNVSLVHGTFKFEYLLIFGRQWFVGSISVDNIQSTWKWNNNRTFEISKYMHTITGKVDRSMRVFLSFLDESIIKFYHYANLCLNLKRKDSFIWGNDM